MVERVLLLLVVAIAVAAAVAAAQWVARARTRRLLHASGAELGALWEALALAPDGRPTVVAFSTPSCAACRTAQAPALEAVRQRVGERGVRVVRVDAARQPDVARAFGVLTVPTTVVLTPDGQVAAVNHGFASAARLAAQIEPPGVAAMAARSLA